MDYAAIHAAIVGLKAASDISTTLLGMKVTGEVQAKVIELQTALLGVQSAALLATTAQYELQERVRTLEAQLKKRVDWETIRTRYRLVSPWRSGAQVYALRRDASDGEQPHVACTACFHNERIVILNPVSKNTTVQMICPACRAVLDTSLRRVGSPAYAEDYDSQHTGQATEG